MATSNLQPVARYPAVLVSGASGLIGSALVPCLTRSGHRVIELRRHTAGQPAPTAWWNPEAGTVNLEAAGTLDAVVHLAGESVAQRWTPAAKARIRDSRVRGTRLLAETFAKLPNRPQVLVCASAIGYYGDRGVEILDEQSPAGAGFLPEVCRAWEEAAAPARAAGIRVVHLRLGVVLAPNGGALAKLLPAFRWGVGGPFGSGNQYWSWTTLADLLRVVQYVLENESLQGPVNAVAPHPATNRVFAQTLGRALHRPSFFTVPAFAVKLLLGQMGQEALLASARVFPRKLEQSGFVFEHPELGGALRQVLDNPKP